MDQNNPKRKTNFPVEWLNHAESDLRLARLALGDSLVHDQQLCFHAQQAAEKAIKAVLLVHRIDFPLTHDIEELMEIAENNGIKPPDYVQDAGQLTPYAVETRYPGSWVEISENDVHESLIIAENAINWAKKIVTTKEGGDL